MIYGVGEKIGVNVGTGVRGVLVTARRSRRDEIYGNLQLLSNLDCIGIRYIVGGSDGIRCAIEFGCNACQRIPRLYSVRNI